MATLTVATSVRTGVDMTGASCAGGGDAFANTGQEVLHIINGDASPHTVTIVTQVTRDSQTVTALAVVCAANKTTAIGPFPMGIYNDTNGLVQITYSAVTSMSAKVLKVTPA